MGRQLQLYPLPQLLQPFLVRLGTFRGALEMSSGVAEETKQCRGRLPSLRAGERLGHYGTQPHLIAARVV